MAIPFFGGKTPPIEEIFSETFSFFVCFDNKFIVTEIYGDCSINVSKGDKLKDKYKDIDWDNIINSLDNNVRLSVIIDKKVYMLFYYNDKYYILPPFLNEQDITYSWIENVKQPMMVIHISGYLELINDMAKAFMGIDTYKGLNVVDIFAPDFMEKILDGINITLQNGNVVLKDIKMQTADKWVYLYMSLMPTNKGDKIFCFIADATELYELKTRMGRFEEFSMRVFNAIEQGFVILNKEGRIVDFNAFMRKKYRWRKSNIGENIFEKFPMLINYDFDKKFTEIMEKKKSIYVENVDIKSITGEDRIQDIFAYPLMYEDFAEGVVVIINDVTEKKNLEKEVKKKSQKDELLSILTSYLMEALEEEGILKIAMDVLKRYLPIKEAIGITIKNQSLFVPLAYFNGTKCVNKNNIKYKEFLLSDAPDIIQKIIRTNSIMLERNCDNNNCFFNNKKCIELGLPFTGEKGLLGIIIVSLELSDITQDDIEFLYSVIMQVSISLEKANIYEKEKETVKRLKTILSLNQILFEGNNYKDSFELFIKKIAEYFEGENAVLGIKYKWEDKIRIVASIGNNDFNEGDMINVAISENAKIYEKDDYSVLLVPVFYKNTVSGMLEIMRDKKNPFNDMDMLVLSGFAQQVSPQLHTLTMYREIEQRLQHITILYDLSQMIREKHSVHIEDAIEYIKKSIEYIDDITIFSLIGNRLKPIYGMNKSLVVHENEQDILDKMKGGTFVTDEWQSIESEIVGTIKNRYGVVSIEEMKFEDEYVYIIIGAYDKKYASIYIENLAFIKMVINELFVFIRDIKLSSETKKKWQEMLVIGQTLTSLSQMKDLKHLLNYVVESAARLTNSVISSLLLIDEEDKTLKFKAVYGLDFDKLKDKKIDINSGIVGYVARTGKSQLINNAKDHPLYMKISDLYYTVDNMINVPLIVGDKIIGVLCVDNSKEDFYTKSDLHILQVLSSVSSTIIQNTSLYEKTVEQLNNEKLINDITMLIQKRPDFVELWEIIYEKLKEKNGIKGFNMLVYKDGEMVDYFDNSEVPMPNVGYLIGKIKEYRKEEKSTPVKIIKDGNSMIYHYCEDTEGGLYAIISIVSETNIAESFFASLGHILISFYDNMYLIRRYHEKITEMEVIYRIAGIFNEVKTWQEALEKVVDVIGYQLNFKYVGILIYDEKKKVLRVVANREHEPGLELSVDKTKKSIILSAFRKQTIQNIPDVTVYDNYLGVRKDAKSELSVPLKWHDEVMGILNVEHTEVNAFSPATERMFINIADQLARFMKNSELYKKLRESYDKVKEERDLREYIFEGINLGIILMDSKGIPVDFNSKMSSLIPDDTQIDKKDLLKHILRKKDIDKIYKIIKKGTVNIEWETQSVNKRKIRIIMRSLKKTKNVIKGYLLGIDDITEKKEAEKKIAESENLIKMGEMAAAMAHEIKNPLASIKLVAQFLQGQPDNEAVPVMVEKMIAEIDRLDRLVRDITDFSKKPGIEPQKTNIKEIVEEAVSVCMSGNHENIKVKISIPDDIGIICVDGDRIKEVLINLIINAVQAIGDKKGKIKIKVSIFSKILKIIVTDNAGGIPEEIRDKIFDPFFTTKKKEGTGLGLAISKKIMLAHNGDLVYKPKKDGSEFIVKAELLDECN